MNVVSIKSRRASLIIELSRAAVPETQLNLLAESLNLSLPQYSSQLVVGGGLLYSISTWV